MQYDKSCGAILFTRVGGEVQYLLIQNISGYYGFPKGRVEHGETEEETALREIFEEVAIRPRLIPGFREVDEHPIPGIPGIMKQVVYFIGEYSNQGIRYQKEELTEAFLAPFDKAYAFLQFDRIREIFRDANEFVELLN